MDKSLIICTLFAFVIYYGSNAQTVSGKLIDAENNIEIDSVKITDLHSDYKNLSDIDGNLSIPVFGTYLFEKSYDVRDTMPFRYIALAL